MENQLLQQFAAEWNALHPELPAECGESVVLIRQKNFPYGNIDVQIRNGAFDIYVSKFDGEEMEPEPLPVAVSVKEAIASAEWGVHAGHNCCVCGKEQPKYFSWGNEHFWKIGCKLYCSQHKPV